MAWDKETELRLRQVIKDSGVALLNENLVQGTWGNTAVRLDEDHMLVTPTGLDYIALTPEDMPVVQISDPSVWSDGKKPTSERKIHAAIMQARADINATIHSHPIYCSILASARIEVRSRLCRAETLALWQTTACSAQERIWTKRLK